MVNYLPKLHCNKNEVKIDAGTQIFVLVTK